AYRAGERWADYPLAARVLPRHVLAAADAGARAKFAREPVHAGPFAVAAWIPGFGVTLSAFKDHVLGPPALGRIEIRFLSDRRAARALLAAAGFARGNFGILERGGERMTVALLVASGSVGRTDAARRVAGDLAAVGIAAEVRERPIADVLGLVARGEFDLALMPQRADDPDVATEVYR